VPSEFSTWILLTISDWLVRLPKTTGTGLLLVPTAWSVKQLAVSEPAHDRMLIWDTPT
jgi:hypothetical protein